MKKISDEQKKEIAMALKIWILSRSTIVSFCEDNEININTLNSWFKLERSISLQNAIKLEKITKGDLKKEFLCPKHF